MAYRGRGPRFVPPPEETHRINRKIRTPQVRLIGTQGEQIGIVPIDEALRLAEQAQLDLVEIAPKAQPPVCRILDYGKHKYDEAKKQRQARKNAHNVEIKGIRLRSGTESHDIGFKLKDAIRFLEEGHKVQVTLIFRGRETAHPEIARAGDDGIDLGLVGGADLQMQRDAKLFEEPAQRHVAASGEGAADPTPHEAPVDPVKARELFEELEALGVVHDVFGQVHRLESRRLGPERPRERREDLDHRVHLQADSVTGRRGRHRHRASADVAEQLRHPLPLAMEAAVEEARRRGATKLSLRVLGHNQGARRVYERCGFHVEGVLTGEFVLDGVAVDDVLMARTLD